MWLLGELKGNLQERVSTSASVSQCVLEIIKYLTLPRGELEMAEMYLKLSKASKQSIGT